MSETVKRIVKKQFKYGKKVYKPGDEFVPAGGLYDDQIIEYYTIEQRVEKPRRTRKKVTNE